MLKRSLIIFSILTLALAALMPVLPLQGESDIYDKTLRLHVLANSDSEGDQELKLKVRDSIIEYMSEYMNDAGSKEEAIELAEQHRDALIENAKSVIAENGYSYDVDITLTEEYYPTREYEGVALPAGSYTSLRVLIGEAKGQNWWCILFPALCTNTCEAKEELKSAGFTSPQIKVLTEGESPKYKIRFRILELFEKWF